MGEGGGGIDDEEAGIDSDHDRYFSRFDPVAAATTGTMLAQHLSYSMVFYTPILYVNVCYIAKHKYAQITDRIREKKRIEREL